MQFGGHPKVTAELKLLGESCYRLGCGVVRK